MGEKTRVKRYVCVYVCVSEGGEGSVVRTLSQSRLMSASLSVLHCCSWAIQASTCKRKSPPCMCARTWVVGSLIGRAGSGSLGGREGGGRGSQAASVVGTECEQACVIGA